MDHSTAGERFSPPFHHHCWYVHTCLRRAIEGAMQTNGLSRSGQRIVDFGCGDRPYASLFAGCEYVARDLDGGIDLGR